jgi:hypothetical protein
MRVERVMPANVGQRDAPVRYRAGIESMRGMQLVACDLKPSCGEDQAGKIGLDQHGPLDKNGPSLELPEVGPAS